MSKLSVVVIEKMSLDVGSELSSIASERIITKVPGQSIEFARVADAHCLQFGGEVASFFTPPSHGLRSPYSSDSLICGVRLTAETLRSLSGKRMKISSSTNPLRTLRLCGECSFTV